MQKRSIWIWVVGAAAAIFLLFYGLSPVLAANALARALKTGDQDKLEQLVDFPSVREHLKDDLRTGMMAKVRSDSKDDSLATGLALLVGPALIDRAVDNFITPAMISKAIRNAQTHKDAGASAKSDGADKTSSSKAHYAYDGLNRFKITYRSDNGSAIAFDMTRQGLFGWRVTRIEMPADLLGGLSHKRSSNDNDNQ